MVVPAHLLSEHVLQKSSLGRKMKIIGSLASHLGISDNEFGELLAAGKLSKFWSCYKNLGLRVKKHRDNYITWIDFDEAFSPSWNIG